ncbi:MAG: phage virion morphogenesis protein [Roseomonas mucosa]|nr:phage virion morphogenesis protein [Roseomonas mucosa]
MSGARIEAHLDLAELREAAERVRALGRHPEPMLRAIGVGLVRNTQDRFDAEKDPQGQPWKALSPAYKAVKKGPGILREAGMRGGLQGSITFDLDGEGIVVGSIKAYAGIHQFGGTIKFPARQGTIYRHYNAKTDELSTRFVKRSKSNFAQDVMIPAYEVKMPARPYLGISAEDEDTVLDVVEGYVARAIQGKAVR